MAEVKKVPQELLLIFESAGFLQGARKRRNPTSFILENGVRNAYFCENAAAIAEAQRSFILP